MGRTNALDAVGAGLQRSVDGIGLDSMMAVGVPPWHYAQNKDLVRLLDKDAKITSVKVNKAAGLDWEVGQTPIYIPMTGLVPGYEMVGDVLEAGQAAKPSFLANVRSDNNRVVGVVRPGYKVFQNAEAPLFLDSLVDDGSALYETAGSLHGGSQVWWLMRIPNGVTVGGQKGEELNSFILFQNTHDGSLSWTISIVTIRVVCQNTLAWALDKAQRTMKVRHTKNAGVRIEEARRALEIGFVYQEEMAKVGDQLLNTKFTDKQFNDFLNSLIPLPEPNAEDGKVKNQFAITQATKQRDALTEVYANHPTQVDIKGTAWGVVQAAQFYADHVAFTKTAESRFVRLTKGQNIGSKAFTQMKELVLA